MNLHIIQDSIYINQFIETCNKLENRDNEFIICSPEPSISLKKGYNIKYLTLKQISNFKFISKFEKIYLHGFGGERFTFIWANYFRFLYLKIINKKPLLIWMFFGNEFYSVIKQNKSVDTNSIVSYLNSIKHQNFNFKIFLQRKLIFQEIDYICHFIAGEVDLVRKYFNLNAKYIPFFYGANFIDFGNTISINEELKTIILGNSATPANNHIQVAKTLKRIPALKNVFVPLSYGSQKYKEFVTIELNRLLGEKYKPLFDFMEYAVYVDLLVGVDAGVFNYYRSQGMGNIIQLIILGKPVFLNSKNPAFSFFEKLGVKIGNINNLEKDFLAFNIKNLSRNKEIILNYFSENNEINNYKRILSI